MKGGLPFTDFGGTGPLLHLAHANGFPPGTYSCLARRLAARYHVVAWGSSPLVEGTVPSAFASWWDAARDLIDALSSRGMTGLVGAGHSFGGVITLMASVLEPGLFSEVVLLDPVLFEGARMWMWKAAKALGLGGRLELVKNALARREHWPDRETARRSYASKPLFADWDPECFEDYREHGLVEAPTGGVRLAYPREWEARVFQTTPADPWRWVGRVSVPVAVLRGENSQTFTRRASKKFLRHVPGARLSEVPGCGHMFPMERPDLAAGIMFDVMS